MQTTDIDNSIYLLTSNPNLLPTDTLTAIVAVSSLFADPLNEVSSMCGTLFTFVLYCETGIIK